MRREWRENAKFAAAFAPANLWLRLGVAGLVVAMVIGALSQLLVPPWWMRSGLPVNPGNFEARVPIDYPVCAPWKNKAADFARADLQVTDGSSQKPIAAGDQTTLGIALPAKAKVRRIYCATAGKECSFLGCLPPLSILATDNIYTRNRVISLALTDKEQQSAPVDVRVWVVWQ